MFVMTFFVNCVCDDILYGKKSMTDTILLLFVVFPALNFWYYVLNYGDMDECIAFTSELLYLHVFIRYLHLFIRFLSCMLPQFNNA